MGTVNTRMKHNVWNTGAMQSRPSTGGGASQLRAVPGFEFVRDDPEVRWVRFTALLLIGLIGALLLLLASRFFVTRAEAAPVQSHANIQDVLILDHGLYTPLKDPSRPLPPGVPQISSELFQLVVETTSVPAKVGIQFGFRYKIFGHPSGAPVETKAIFLYPQAGAVSPKMGLLHSTSMSKTVRINESSGIAYSVDEPWELVPGIWTVQLWIDDRKVAEQSFNMVSQKLATN